MVGIILGILIVVCIALVGVILLQQSEGGALGMGGGPQGFMSARGAGDLLTRITWILAGLFFALCLALTFVSGHSSKGSVVDRLKVDAMNPDAFTPKQPATPPAGQAPANGGFEAPKPEVHNTVPAAPADPFGNLGGAKVVSGSTPAQPASKPANKTN
jgi:preprotein translocase subunit SecG